MYSSRQRWVYYFALCYIINLVLYFNFASHAKPDSLSADLFLLVVTITYPAIFLLPVGVFALIGIKLQERFGTTSWLEALFNGLVVLLCFSLTLSLYIDAKLFDLYGYHINAFVLNLLVTPGGIESLGGSDQTFITAFITVLIFVALHGSLFFIAGKIRSLPSIWPTLKILLISGFVLLSISERFAYGISDIKQYSPVLEATAVFPLYNRVKFRGIAKSMGIEPVSRSNLRVEETTQVLNYPLAPILTHEVKSPPNIIWLVSESLRWDMLDPTIMPNTYERSKKGLRFLNNYSGGNGTRQGLFSLFYGIYGCYWDSFLAVQRSPLFLDLLQQQNYELQMFTSADFTYPEFDQTLFANVPQAHLHQFNTRLAAWKRDVQNTDQINKFLKTRDKNKPFMVFMFYESTHARYDFPPQMVLRKPYLKDLNYATMTRDSLAGKIGELKNRYINAAHFIDSEMGKIYETLDEQGLWDNTIVMMTGDHGEEFMENGFWGHNSGFSEQQIRTPMVMWIPGEAPRVIDRRTSHMDVVPTILPRLGVDNPISDYSLGQSMLDEKPGPYLVVSDWAGVGYMNDGFKFTMPFKSSLALSNKLFDDKDKPVSNIVPFLSAHRDELSQVLLDARRFLKQ